MELQRIIPYLHLMRLHKPIGILLLLWPTLWALWLASNGPPPPNLLIIFIAGVMIMRTVGCIINDYWDRDLDARVRRTRYRPLANKQIPLRHVLSLIIFFSAMAFALVVMCNALTIQLAFIGALLTVIYPLLKRSMPLPQLGLGVAFSWGVPMAFAAVRGSIGTDGWFLFVTAMIWPIIYDTIYAMMDRDDDRRIGIRSAAILFAQMDRLVIALLQLLFITMLIIIGLMFHLRVSFYMALLLATVLFVYQHWLLQQGTTKAYLRAFHNNNWVGILIFLGILFNAHSPVSLSALWHGHSELDIHQHDMQAQADYVQQAQTPTNVAPRGTP